jgi:hypothetical protein
MMSVLHRLRRAWRLRRHPGLMSDHAIPGASVDKLSGRQAQAVNETKAMSGEFD